MDRMDTMSDHKKAYLYLISALVSWGSLYVAGKYVLETVPSFCLLFLRYLIAVAVLLVIYRNHPRPKIEKGDFRSILLIGIVGYFFAVGLQLLGTHYCSASMASLITSMNPAMIILLAFPILHERITLHKGLAVIVTLVGTVVVIGDLGSGNTVIGVVFSFISMAAWSLASVIVRLACRSCDSIIVTLYGMSVGLLLALPAALIEWRVTGFQFSEITPLTAVWIVYIGIVCTAGGLLFWNKALESLSAATCSLFYPIQPLTSAILGVLFLGEVLNSNYIIGGALIIGGILYAVISGK